MKTYYECHITMAPGGGAFGARPDVENQGWSYSCIEDDPELGPGVKQYATKQFKQKHCQKAFDEMELVAVILARAGHKVLRQKIELVVHDIRTPGGLKP